MAPAILLLINRYVPLALAVLAAEIVNIIAFHITMAPSGLPMALVVGILWVLVAWCEGRLLWKLLRRRFRN